MPVSVHDPLAVLPKKPIAVMQTPMIKANMTAYSTAVAPRSSRTNRKKRFIVALLAGRGGRERAGDPPVLVASSDRIQKDLGWRPRYTDLRALVETAWNWHRSRPKGYND